MTDLNPQGGVRLTWTTEKRKINDLVPFSANPRKMNSKQVDDLKRSLEKFNLVEVPAIDTDNTILAGHQRLRIMQMLGRGNEEIDVRVPNRKLTQDEFNEYNIRSNKNVGEWDFDALANFGEQMLLDTGFESMDLDKIFGLGSEDEDDFDLDAELEAITTPTAKIGDIYQLGEHRLMCGDSTNAEHVAKLMDGTKADMVFTDPPYNVAYEGGGSYANHGTPKREMIQNDKMSTEEFAEFMNKALRNMLENCEGVFYVCMSSKELASLKDAFERNGGHWQAFIIWAKNTFTLSRSDWQNQYEPILYGWNKDCVNHYFVGWRDEGNVWDDIETLNPSYDGVKTTIKLGEYQLELEGLVKGQVINKKDKTDIWREKKPTKSKEHPTMKPIKLVAKALQASSKRGQIVLDLFGGSGSTLIASEQSGRRCYTMELDPKYVDVIIERYKKLTGNEAEKIN